MIWKQKATVEKQEKEKTNHTHTHTQIPFHGSSPVFRVQERPDRSVWGIIVGK